MKTMHKINSLINIFIEMRILKLIWHFIKCLFCKCDNEECGEIIETAREYKLDGSILAWFEYNKKK